MNNYQGVLIIFIRLQKNMSKNNTQKQVEQKLQKLIDMGWKPFDKKPYKLNLAET